MFSLAGAAVGGDPGGGLGFSTALRVFKGLAPFCVLSRCFGGGPAGGAGLRTLGAGSTIGFGSPGTTPPGGAARGGLGPGMTAGGSPGGGLGLLIAEICPEAAGLTESKTFLAKFGGRGVGKAKGLRPAGGGRTGGTVLAADCVVS